jgi:purine-binding chemotaxis protein CheW
MGTTLAIPHASPGVAATHLLVFAFAGRRCALPLAAVERVLRSVAVTALPKAPASVLGIVNVHGVVLPVLDPAVCLGGPAYRPDLHGRMLIVRSPRRWLVLAVDTVLDIIPCPPCTQTLPPTLTPDLAGVAGVLAQPDGLILIQDLDAFLSPQDEAALTQALEAGTDV